MATPLEIEIGLHYWCSADGDVFDEIRRDAPAVREALNDMEAAGLIQRTVIGSQKSALYERTDALGVWVKALSAIPWPVQQWVICIVVAPPALDDLDTGLIRR